MTVQVINQSPLLVIDGQQRLTSVMLILEALARALGDEEQFSSEKVRSYFLLNPLEKGDCARQVCSSFPASSGHQIH